MRIRMLVCVAGVCVRARARAWVRVCARVSMYSCLSLWWTGWKDGRGHASFAPLLIVGLFSNPTD